MNDNGKVILVFSVEIDKNIRRKYYIDFMLWLFSIEYYEGLNENVDINLIRVNYLV